jgi:hypothetical protein
MPFASDTREYLMHSSFIHGSNAADGQSRLLDMDERTIAMMVIFPSPHDRADLSVSLSLSPTISGLLSCPCTTMLVQTSHPT